jgi:hypothetical protein
MLYQNDIHQKNIHVTPLPVKAVPPPRKKGHWVRNLGLLALVVLLLGAGTAFASQLYSVGNQLQIRIGEQQPAQVDLRQSIAVSADVLGANVFPQEGTSSQDQTMNGFMSYSSAIVNGLQSAHIKLLRFPGGSWGEEHTYSLDQLNAFSTLLNEIHGDGMMQVQLTGPGAEPGNMPTRASQAGLVVDYMNNQHSRQRTGKYTHATFHPVALWTVGNEPDLLINPDTGQKYTADEYANAFIQFSLAMHQSDPSIKVFGPEISQFYGVGAGPRDASGKLWMEEFLLRVSNYERAHPTLRFHILDGVSFHLYQFDNAQEASAQLLSSPDEWAYLLPPLRQLIRQDFDRDIPVAVTEVNTNPNNAVPQRALAAVWWADTLGRLMSQQVQYAAFFSAEGVDTPYPLFLTKGLQETPMLRAMQLFAHLQQNYVPVEVERDPVSTYVTTDGSRQTVSLLFVNKSALRQQALVSPQQTLLPTSTWPTLTINLAPYSIVEITMQRNGGAEAYNFVTPAHSDTTPEISQTSCGQGNATQSGEAVC